MISKKIAILFALASACFLKFNNIYVNEGFENPLIYKITYVFGNSVGLIGRYLDGLNLVPEYSFVRDAIDFMVYTDLDPKDNSIEYKVFNNVNVRVYRPNTKSDSPLPVMVYFHGGGYYIRNMNFYDKFLFIIAKKSNIVVISVDYRLAPEHPFPTPTDDCWKAVDYVLKNSKSLKVNPNKLILAGDSAGGNAALVISKRLAKETNVKPILQVLIYPWVQLGFTRIPSSIMYKEGLFASTGYANMKLWYLGFKKITDEMRDAITSNNHTLLLTQEERVKLASYVNIDLIPQKYKTNKAYYEMYKKIPLINSGTLEPDNILVRDKEFAKKVKLFFSKEVSPLLSDSDELKLMPKTYQITCEWDSLKDQGLILAERLKQVGVEVDVAFYENCYHGSVTALNEHTGYKHSYEILDKLNDFIKLNI